MEINEAKEILSAVEEVYKQKLSLDLSSTEATLILASEDYFYAKLAEGAYFLAPVDIPFWGKAAMPNAEDLIRVYEKAFANLAEYVFSREYHFGNYVYVRNYLPKSINKVTMAHATAHAYQNGLRPDAKKINEFMYNTNQKIFETLDEYIGSASKPEIEQKRRDLISFVNILGMIDFGKEKPELNQLLKNVVEIPPEMNFNEVFRLAVEKSKAIDKQNAVKLLSEGFATDCHQVYSKEKQIDVLGLTPPEFYLAAADLYKELRTNNGLDCWKDIAIGSKDDRDFIDRASKELGKQKVKDIFKDRLKKYPEEILGLEENKKPAMKVVRRELDSDGFPIYVIDIDEGFLIYDEELFWVFSLLGYNRLVCQKKGRYTVAIKPNDDEYFAHGKSHEMKGFISKPFGKQNENLEEALEWIMDD